MEFWICPVCGCVNDKDHSKCDGCALPLWTPIPIQFVHSENLQELDTWIANAHRFLGAKVWRRREG